MFLKKYFHLCFSIFSPFSPQFTPIELFECHFIKGSHLHIDWQFLAFTIFKVTTLVFNSSCEIKDLSVRIYNFLANFIIAHYVSINKKNIFIARTLFVQFLVMSCAPLGPRHSPLVVLLMSRI